LDIALKLDVAQLLTRSTVSKRLGQGYHFAQLNFHDDVNSCG